MKNIKNDSKKTNSVLTLVGCVYLNCSHVQLRKQAALKERDHPPNHGRTNFNVSFSRYVKRAVTAFLTGIKMLSFQSSTLPIQKDNSKHLALCWPKVLNAAEAH